jgi:hypothetical protein
VVPSNRKWFRNLLVSEVVCEAFESLGMQWPEPAEDLSKISLK